MDSKSLLSFADSSKHLTNKQRNALRNIAVFLSDKKMSLSAPVFSFNQIIEG